jgi:hypothetical protein
LQAQTGAAFYAAPAVSDEPQIKLGTRRNGQGMTTPLLAWYNNAENGKEGAVIILKIWYCNGRHRK